MDDHSYYNEEIDPPELFTKNVLTSVKDFYVGSPLIKNVSLSMFSKLHAQ